MDLAELARSIYRNYYPYFNQYRGLQLFPTTYQQGIDLIPYRDINIDVKGLPKVWNSLGKASNAGFGG